MASVGIVSGNYDKVFTLKTASRNDIIAMLSVDVVLHDFDQNVTIVSTAAVDKRGDVADHLISIQGEPQGHPAPDYRDLGDGAVLCLNHMKRGIKGPAPCVDLVTVDVDGKVTQINICFVQNSGHFNV